LIKNPGNLQPSKAGKDSDEGKHVILVVEDETNNRFLLQTYLSSEGYIVELARSGEEAIEKAEKVNPSVIILDVMLPGMDGFETCRQLKKRKNVNFTPVILVTALRGNQERIQGTEAGADDFISKPVNRIELLTRIKSLLRIKRLHETLESKINELETVKAKLRKLAITDGLTGLFNYRAFRKQLKLEISRSKRFNLPVSLIIMDIDHFKNYNDLFGHPRGDRVLKIFAKLISENIRDLDFLARYGGEEFALILPGTGKKEAGIVAEKIRHLIEDAPFPEENKLPGRCLTVSLGLASFPKDTDNENELIRFADEALYKAKINGRNRWVPYGK